MKSVFEVSTKVIYQKIKKSSFSAFVKHFYTFCWYCRFLNAVKFAIVQICMVGLYLAFMHLIHGL